LNQFFDEELKSTDSLNNYPTIKNIFMDLNTDLPSSAAVERLFSIAGDVFRNKRACLSDSNFEYQLLLKCNKLFL